MRCVSRSELQAASGCIVQGTKIKWKALQYRSIVFVSLAVANLLLPVLLLCIVIVRTVCMTCCNVKKLRMVSHNILIFVMTTHTALGEVGISFAYNLDDCQIKRLSVKQKFQSFGSTEISTLREM